MQLMREYAARARAARSGFDIILSPGSMRDGLLMVAMKIAGAAKKVGRRLLPRCWTIRNIGGARG